MSRLLTSLLLVEERLLECEYFIRQLSRTRGDLFRFNLNAFLSSSRAVTFLIQKELSKVADFQRWWATQPAAMKSDLAMRYFLELRNFSQKEGRVSLVGYSVGSSAKKWRYRFAGNRDHVPESLVHRDVVDCCCEHLGKLAQLTLDCAEHFPFHTCPRRALTEAGILALDLDISAVEAMLSLPVGWSDLPNLTSAERLDLLREHVDGVDFVKIVRLSQIAKKRRSPIVRDDLGERFSRALINRIEARVPR